MKADETQSKVEDSGQAHRGRFVQIRDSRQRKVPGLWQRNGRYYAALWVDRGDGKKTARRFPLEASNLSEAKEQMEVKRNERREDQLPTQGRKPLLSDAIAEYLASPLHEDRRAGTLEKDRRHLQRIVELIGDVRIDRITPEKVVAFQEKRLAEGVAKRTVNLDLISLRGLLKYAVSKRYIRALPYIANLKTKAKEKRTVITPAEFERLLATAVSACPRNGQQLADYLRLLAFSGAREQEALRLKWADVDFAAGTITLGSDGLAKNGLSRKMQFHPQLEALLRDMASRRVPAEESDWLFPSYRRSKDGSGERTATFRNSLRLVRVKAGLPRFGFHDLRHYFASVGVMAGIDFMTVSEWLGHKDGGILVGKTYGHLLDEHKKEAAQKLSFGLRVLPAASAA